MSRFSYVLYKTSCTFSNYGFPVLICVRVFKSCFFERVNIFVYLSVETESVFTI